MKTRKRLRFFDEKVASELVAAGYASRDEGLLVATNLALGKQQQASARTELKSVT